jgi:hypothetical protein
MLKTFENEKKRTFPLLPIQMLQTELSNTINLFSVCISVSVCLARIVNVAIRVTLIIFT